MDYMRLFSIFSIFYASSYIMNTCDISEFVKHHNDIIKQIANIMLPRNNGSCSVIEHIGLCEQLFDGINSKGDDIKAWCQTFWHDNKCVLWLMRAHTLGITAIDESSSTTYNHILMPEFKEPGFEIFFKSNILWKEYSLSFADAEATMDRLRQDTPLLPEIIAIHGGRECQYYDWYDECDMCFKKNRAIETYIEKEIAKSNNIFLNIKLFHTFFQDLIQHIQKEGIPEIFHASLKKWSIYPILEIDRYSKDDTYIITNITNICTNVEKRCKDTFKPGKTPLQIMDSWISSIIRPYFHFGTHSIYRIIQNNMLKEYDLFFKVFYTIEVMCVLIESQRNCAKMIRDMF